jgi:hypothetical protein
MVLLYEEDTRSAELSDIINSIMSFNNKKRPFRNVEINELIQNLIYLMNDNHLRREIIVHHIEQFELNHLFRWCGTINCNLKESSIHLTQKIKQLSLPSPSPTTTTPRPVIKFKQIDINKIVQLIKKNMDKFIEKPYALFTFVLVYDGFACHYVSFIYNRERKELISFDPGVQLYEHGQNTIVPVMKQVFYRLKLISVENNQIKDNEYDFGKCHETFCGKEYGIQYNGYGSLPADAFCQSWTIYFLIRFIICQGKTCNFVKDWCQVPPQDREGLILTEFLIPILQYSPNAKRIYMNLLADLKKSYSELVDTLQCYTEKTFLHHLDQTSKQKISCPNPNYKK